MITPILNPLYPVKLIEKERSHYYQIGEGETWLPGVTTVLKVLDKPALVPWAAKSVSDNIYEELSKLKEMPSKEELKKICEDGKNIYKKKSQEAADIGSRVHKAINQLIEGEIDDISYVDADIRAGVQGFLDWKGSNSLRIELGDTKIGSKLFGYGGSLDMVAFEGQNAIIFDFKTTKKRRDRVHGIYDEYALQLAAYAQAFRETYGIEVKKVFALWLNKEKPEFKAVEVKNIPLCFEGFLAALKIHQVSRIEKFDDLII